MVELTPEQIKDFVKGLTQLSTETGVVVGGCGCCSSPYLIPLGEDTGFKAKPGGKYVSQGDGDVEWKNES